MVINGIENFGDHKDISRLFEYITNILTLEQNFYAKKQEKNNFQYVIINPQRNEFNDKYVGIFFMIEKYSCKMSVSFDGHMTVGSDFLCLSSCIFEFNLDTDDQIF